MAVTISDGRGGRALAPGLAAWLAGVAPAGAPSDVAIALVSDARIRALNRRFRRTDAATDVCFPARSRTLPTSSLRRAWRAARRRSAGHAYADELKILALHGLLHLMGYDHHARTTADAWGAWRPGCGRKAVCAAGLIERAAAPKR